MRYIQVEISARKNMKLRGRKYKLYHVSPITDEPIIEMSPRIPSNNMTNGGFEENKTPRISFAPSIGKCLAALAQDIKGKKFRVYALDYLPRGKWVLPNEVEDADITKEYWVTEKVKPIYLGIIHVINAKPKSFNDMDDNFKVDPIQFIQDNYPNDFEKGSKLYKMYNEDKKKYRSFKTKSMGKDRAYSYDWSWKWDN